MQVVLYPEWHVPPLIEGIRPYRKSEESQAQCAHALLLAKIILPNLCFMSSKSVVSACRKTHGSVTPHTQESMETIYGSVRRHTRIAIISDATVIS
jgi:hypothetical protein